MPLAASAAVLPARPRPAQRFLACRRSSPADTIPKRAPLGEATALADPNTATFNRFLSALLQPPPAPILAIVSEAAHIEPFRSETEKLMQQRLSLLLELHEQARWGYLFCLRMVNEFSHSLFIPTLEITDLHFAPVENPRPLQWYTHLLISAESGGTIIGPTCNQTFMFRARPCAVNEDTTRFHDNWEYRRWCVRLVQGEYLVWYDLSVDESYFNPDSHLRYADIRKMAEQAGANLWYGSAKSNVLNIYHAEIG
jgi:hypothetical protein